MISQRRALLFMTMMKTAERPKSTYDDSAVNSSCCCFPIADLMGGEPNELDSADPSWCMESVWMIETGLSVAIECVMYKT